MTKRKLWLIIFVIFNFLIYCWTKLNACYVLYHCENTGTLCCINGNIFMYKINHKIEAMGEQSILDTSQKGGKVQFVILRNIDRHAVLWVKNSAVVIVLYVRECDFLIMFRSCGSWQDRVKRLYCVCILLFWFRPRSTRWSAVATGKSGERIQGSRSWWTHPRTEGRQNFTGMVLGCVLYKGEYNILVIKFINNITYWQWVKYMLFSRIFLIYVWFISWHSVWCDKLKYEAT